MIHHGDCLDVMAAMEPESVDAVVTDPPYGLEFMGKEWDKLSRQVVSGGAGIYQPGIGTRPIGWPSFGGSPNPSCTNCGGSQRGNDRKGFKRCRCDRPSFPNHQRAQAVAMQAWHQQWAEAAYRVAKPSAYLLAFGGTRTVHRMTVALEDAGWIIRDMLVWAYASGFPKSKASLKPAWEPIVMARKPGPLRELAIDACRIPFQSSSDAAAAAAGYADSLRNGRITPSPSIGKESRDGTEYEGPDERGRWPANVILTDPIFDGGVEGVVGGGATTSGDPSGSMRNDLGWFGNGSQAVELTGYGDSGTYSRFFLIPKADRADREPVLGGLPERRVARLNAMGDEPPAGIDPVSERFTTKARQNVHPTVKPTELMRHLVRLVTPAGGLVLDPFLGSGTTGLACELEGFPWVGIEREAEYVKIAEARLNGTQKGLGLVG